MNQRRPPAPPSSGTQTGKAVLVIAAVVFVGWLVLHHGPSSTHVTGSATTRTTHASTSVSTVPPPTTTPAAVPPSSIKLQVLNGVGTGNLATQWSAKLKASPGYNTLPPDDATAKVAASQIYVITPGYLPEANALAVTVGLPATAVNQTIPAPPTAPIRPAERAAANLVLVIGPDLAGRA